MGFVLSVIATVVVLVLIFVMLNRHYGAQRGTGPMSPGSSMGWPAQSSDAAETPDLVQEDVRQMRLAHAALRRRHGSDGLSDRELQEAVKEDELNRSRGRGPFGSE